jgi:hypothetical protein
MMFRKITSFVVALSVLLLMQFAECQAMSLDQQSMQCCKHMPCNPANKAHDCCKKMVTSQTPSILPTPHVPLSVPIAVLANPLPVTEIVSAPEIFWPRIYAPQHSPPDLYIIYASFLI